MVNNLLYRGKDYLENDKVKININEKEIAAGCCNAEPCVTSDCDKTVDVCCTFTIPNGFVFTPTNPSNLLQSLQYSLNTSNIECIVEPCTVQLDQLTPPIEISNPCENDDPLTGCTVKVKRVRLVGCIKIILSLKNIFGDNNSGSDNAICCMETVYVNNIICYTCEDDPCPTLPLTVGPVLLEPAPDDPCGNKTFKFTGTINLPSCS